MMMEPQHFTKVFRRRDEFMAFANEKWVRMLDDGRRQRDGIDVWVADGVTISNIPEECCSECVIYNHGMNVTRILDRLQKSIDQVKSSTDEKYVHQFVRSFTGITSDVVNEIIVDEYGRVDDEQSGVQVRMRCTNVPFQSIDEAATFWTKIFDGMPPFLDAEASTRTVNYTRSMFTLIDEEYNEVKAIVDEHNDGQCKMRLVATDDIATKACLAKLNVKVEHETHHAHAHKQIEIDPDFVKVVMAALESGKLDAGACGALVNIVEKLNQETDEEAARALMFQCIAIIEERV